jgi:hypothetical protein
MYLISALLPLWAHNGFNVDRKPPTNGGLVVRPKSTVSLLKPCRGSGPLRKAAHRKQPALQQLLPPTHDQEEADGLGPWQTCAGILALPTAPAAPAAPR